MATPLSHMSSPVQPLSNPLLYDAVKEALTNKTLHEAMDELSFARVRLCLGVNNLEAVADEAGSGSSSSTMVKEEVVIVEEKEEVEDPGRARSSSWSSIDEWLGQVRHAAKQGFEPMNYYYLRYHK